MASPSARPCRRCPPVIASWSCATLKGDAGAILCVAFSPDGKSIASADDGTIRTWNATTGKSKLVSRGRALSVAFSPDSKFLAAGFYDTMSKAPRGIAKVWVLGPGK